MDNGAKPVEEMSFKEMMGELELIVRSLEAGDLELEESLKRYERGVSLLRASRTKLDEAQQKVTMLLGTIEGDDAAPEPAPAPAQASAPAPAPDPNMYREGDIPF